MNIEEGSLIHFTKNFYIFFSISTAPPKQAAATILGLEKEVFRFPCEHDCIALTDALRMSLLTHSHVPCRSSICRGVRTNFSPLSRASYFWRRDTIILLRSATCKGYIATKGQKGILLVHDFPFQGLIYSSSKVRHNIYTKARFPLAPQRHLKFANVVTINSAYRRLKLKSRSPKSQLGGDLTPQNITPSSGSMRLQRCLLIL